MDEDDIRRERQTERERDGKIWNRNFHWADIAQKVDFLCSIYIVFKTAKEFIQAIFIFIERKFEKFLIFL